MKDTQRKREEDSIRKAEHDQLTTAQKIEKAQARNRANGGQSKKELARLYAILDKEQQAKTQPKSIPTPAKKVGK